MLRKCFHKLHHHHKVSTNTNFSPQQLDCITQIAQEILQSRLGESFLSHDQFAEELAKTKAQQKALEMRLKKEFAIKSIEEKAKKAELLNKVADLNDRVRESLEACKSDSQAFLTEYKNSNREREQEMQIELKKVAGMITVAEGDYKAKIEGVKLRAISLFSGCLLTIFGMIMGERMLISNPKARPKP